MQEESSREARGGSDAVSHSDEDLRVLAVVMTCCRGCFVLRSVGQGFAWKVV